MQGPAIDPNVLQQVEQQVQLFKDEAAPPQERVLAVMRLHHKVCHLQLPFRSQTAHSSWLCCMQTRWLHQHSSVMELQQ
jgi:hypothetical protein